MTAGQYGAALAASITRHPTQEGRAVSDPQAVQDPQPFIVPSTGFLLEYDSQVYQVTATAIHVNLDHDPLGNERHRLDISIRATWAEEGFRDPVEEML